MEDKGIIDEKKVILCRGLFDDNEWFIFRELGTEIKVQVTEDRIFSADCRLTKIERKAISDQYESRK